MMKDKLKKLIPVMLVAVLSLSLVDCSCSEPAKESGSAAESEIASTPAAAEKTTAESREEPGADIAGTYEIIAMVSEGKETSDEDLALMKSKGLTCTLTLEPGGTGVMDLFGEKTELTWDAEAISTGGKAYSYTFLDGKLTLANGSSYLTFAPAGQRP